MIGWVISIILIINWCIHAAKISDMVSASLLISSGLFAIAGSIGYAVTMITRVKKGDE